MKEVRKIEIIKDFNYKEKFYFHKYYKLFDSPGHVSKFFSN